MTSYLLKMGLSFLMLVMSNNAIANCPPLSINKAELINLKEHQWRIEDRNKRQSIAINLLACLADPEPQLRDEIAFEALSFWMRQQQLDILTLHKIRTYLLEKIKINDVDSDELNGFEKPFLALILAEVARVDRLHGFLSEQERQEMLDTAVHYLSNIQDYRGFDEKQGWRHGVAHAADWMMQLSLNPALNDQQKQSMLNALAIQIKTDKHFYHYGESQRLLIPVLLIAMKSSFTQEQWRLWFEVLMESNLDAKIVNQASLARRHNLTQFLNAFFMQLHESKDDKLKTILMPLIVQASKNLH